jgi:hypothetical protein
VRSVAGELVLSLDGERLIVEGTQTFDVRDGVATPRIGFLAFTPPSKFALAWSPTSR